MPAERTDDLNAWTWNQGEVAQAFGVDRSTIHAWQRRGLPYIDNGKGKPSAYVPPLVFGGAWPTMLPKTISGVSSSPTAFRRCVLGTPWITTNAASPTVAMRRCTSFSAAWT